jgi:transposase
MTASATSRAAAAQGIAVSMTTVNRLLIRNAAAPREPKPEDEPLTVVGVDDWAWKKGQRYGTLVVDLLTHRPVAVLADRAAETLADWLRQHPTIQIISRDRGGAYARAAREGAPQAQQVADRFHLLKNWGDHVAAIIGAWSPRSEPSLRDSVPSQPGEPPMLTETRTASPQKQARWAAVHRLYDQGRSIVAIAEELHCDPKTVRKDIAADRPRASEPTVPRSARSEDRLLRELWTGQRMTAQELWEAAQKQGYAKSVSTVARWLRQRRGAVNRGRRAAEMESTSRPENSTPSPKPWTGRQWAHFLGTAWIRLPRRATNAISTRLSQDPAYRQAWTLTRHFQTLVRHRCGPDTLAAWCRMAESSGIPDFVGFARTLKEDWTAVAAGVTMEWSQGPVEGLNNRTKLLKRLMYGRAGLPLLSARILHH